MPPFEIHWHIIKWKKNERIWTMTFCSLKFTVSISILSIVIIIVCLLPIHINGHKYLEHLYYMQYIVTSILYTSLCNELMNRQAICSLNKTLISKWAICCLNILCCLWSSFLETLNRLSFSHIYHIRLITTLCLDVITREINSL